MKRSNTWVYGPMEWVGCIRCEKFQNDFMAQTCASIAQVQPILYRVPFVTKHCQMHRNTKKCSRTWVWFQWIECVLCEKFRCDFMAQTCALIASVQPVLQRVSCSNETLTNAPKNYDTHQNMSLGPNGVDRVIRCKKFWCDFVARTFALIAPVQPVLQLASCSNETIQNAPKHYETHQNMSLWSNGVDRVHSLRKIPMRFRGTIYKKRQNRSLCNPFCTEFRVVMKYCQMHTYTTRSAETGV